MFCIVGSVCVTKAHVAHCGEDRKSLRERVQDYNRKGVSKVGGDEHAKQAVRHNRVVLSLTEGAGCHTKLMRIGKSIGAAWEAAPMLTPPTA